MRYYARIKYAVAVIICAYGISAICMHIIGRDTKEIIEQSKEMNTHENKLISISDFLFFFILSRRVLALYTDDFTLESHFGAHIVCYLYSNLPNEVNR